MPTNPTIRGAIPAPPQRWGRRRCAPTAHGADDRRVGKLGVREVLFGGKVSYVALAVLGIVALVIGIAGGCGRAARPPRSSRRSPRRR